MGMNLCAVYEDNGKWTIWKVHNDSKIFNISAVFQQYEILIQGNFKGNDLHKWKGFTLLSKCAETILY